MTNVLVPYDGSPQAKSALEHALEAFPDDDILVMTVIDPAEASYATGEEYSFRGENWYETAKKDAERLLEEARRAAADRQIETEHVVGRPAKAIVEHIEERPIDHVVMGSHGRTGVSRLILGSVAETVVRRSPVPVTVVR